MRLVKTPLIAGMLVGSVIAAKDHLPFWSSIAFVEAPLLFLAGQMAGIRLPDIDLVLPGFRHRSGITHSFLVPLIFWLMGWHAIAAGLALGTGMHMASDLQPKAWTGGALIKFPMLGSIGLMSPLWILANIIGCAFIWLDAITISTMLDQQLMLMVSLFGVLWYFTREEKKPILPMMSLGFSLLLVHAVREGVISFGSLI